MCSMKLLYIIYVSLLPFVGSSFISSFIESNPKIDVISGPTYKAYIPQIEICMIELDYNSLNISGHKMLTFQRNYVDTFKLLPFNFVNYFAGDFGGFSCTVSNSTDTIAAGTIIWMGEGKLIHPKMLDSTSYKKSQYFSLLTPEAVQYFNTYKEDSQQKKEYIEQTEKIFKKIQTIELLSNFSNKYKIGYYLYTPRIGKTDYSVAKWLVFLVRDIN